MPVSSPAGALAALDKAAAAVGRAAHCRYSSSNAFSFGRARASVAALLKLAREQARAATAGRDAGYVSAWARGALAVADGAHEFDDGVTDYLATLRGVAGKAAQAAAKAAWAKAAPEAVRAALAAAAAHAPAAKPKSAAAAAAAGDDDDEDF